jgi:biopolymer transport protein ExbD
MARGRGHRGQLMEQGQELNLIPYLDIMVNLILFMLVTITSFLSFTILNASIPQIVPDSAKIPEELKKAQLLLMVRVTKGGFNVDPNVQGGSPIARADIRLVEDNKYNFDALKETVGKIKERFPEETRVLIIAEPKIHYEDIIHTMDAVREKEPNTGAGDLFPDVTLSIL